MRWLSSLLGAALLVSASAAHAGDPEAPGDQEPAPLVVAGEGDTPPADPVPTAVTATPVAIVAATPPAPVDRAEPAPESDDLEFGAGLRSFVHHISMHGVLLDDDLGRKYQIDTDVVAGAAALTTVFSFSDWRVLSLSFGGGEFAAAGGAARPLDGRRGSWELDGGNWINGQVATAGLIDVGPIDLVVEARVSVDGIFMKLPGPPTRADIDKVFVLFEGGAALSARYHIDSCLFIEPGYYAGVAGFDGLGYVHGASLMLGCDDKLERGNGKHPG